MNKRRNLLTGFAVFGMLFALLLAALFTACDPIEGNIDEIRQKAEGGKTVPPDTTVYYTVTFESSGGTSVPSQTVKAGDPVPRPTDPTKSGKIFGSWYSDAGLTLAYSFSKPVTTHITLYASWVESGTVKHTVTFNYGDGRSETVEVYHGQKVARPEPDPTRTNYVFDNWYDSTSNPFAFNIGITGDTTILGKWNIKYTVQYNRNSPAGAIVGPDDTNMAATSHAGNQALPVNTFAYRNYDFKGWATISNGGIVYTDGQSASNIPGATAGGTVTLFAKWDTCASLPAGNTSAAVGNTLADRLEWIRKNALTGGTYSITVGVDEAIAPYTFQSGTGYENYTVNLSGSSSSRTVSLTGNGSLFQANSGVKLILGTITLKGHSENNNSLVSVVSGGELVMNTGSTITENTSTRNFSANGSGVNVVKNGTFIMNGGTISNCTNAPSGVSGVANGGGVYVLGTFTMNGGTISGNTANGLGASYGGGVYVGIIGTFTMSGGTISKNSAIPHTRMVANGGGVYVDAGGTFSKIAASGGIIYGNDGGDNANSAYSGVAVYCEANGKAHPVKIRDITLWAIDDFDR